MMFSFALETRDVIASRPRPDSTRLDLTCARPQHAHPRATMPERDLGDELRPRARLFASFATGLRYRLTLSWTCTHSPNMLPECAGLRLTYGIPCDHSYRRPKPQVNQI